MIRSMIRTTIAAGLVSTAAGLATAADPGWTVLFDGTGTDAWKGYGKDVPLSSCGWVVEKGTLRAVPEAQATCDLATKESFKDFDLELEWKVSPGGNSGVMFDVAETGAPSYHTGPEMQVLDDGGHPDGKNARTSAGSLYALVAPVGKTLKPVGEWNQARLVKKGAHVEHWLNGKKVAGVRPRQPRAHGAHRGEQVQGHAALRQGRPGPAGAPAPRAGGLVPERAGEEAVSSGSALTRTRIGARSARSLAACATEAGPPTPWNRAAAPFSAGCARAKARQYEQMRAARRYTPPAG